MSAKIGFIRCAAAALTLGGCFPAPHPQTDVAETAVDDGAEAEVEVDSEAEPEVEVDSETEVGTEPETETEVDSEAETEAEVTVECLVHGDCDDHDPCTGTEICNATHHCESIAPIVCDVSAATCSENRCNPTSGHCEPVLSSDVDCDDADPCTTADTCTAGSCAGTPVVCEVVDPCLEKIGACNPVSGACDFTAKPDGRACVTPDILSGQCHLGKCQPVVLISSKNEHTCVSRGGKVFCWGRGGDGRLGYGNVQDVGDDETPADVGPVDIPGVVIAISAGIAQTCALNSIGQLWCWGSGTTGQLGRGSTDSIGAQQTPGSLAPVDTTPFQFEQLACGGFTCGVTPQSGVVCWGANYVGQLGVGHTNNIGNDEPLTAARMAFAGTAVAVGSVHACALKSGEVFCWGHNASGELGRGDTLRIGDDELASTGAKAVALAGEAIRLAAGWSNTCAILADGKLRCWGDNALGMLGIGSQTALGDNEAVSSVPAIALPGAVARVAAGAFHTCAIVAGDVYCWGYNTRGQMGTPGIEYQYDAAKSKKVALGGVAVDIAAGQHHSCAVLDDASVVCWGENEFGQLGVGDEIDRGFDPGTMPPPRIQFE